MNVATGYLISAEDFELLKGIEAEILDGPPVLPLQQRALGLRLSAVRLHIEEHPLFAKQTHPYSSDALPLDDTASEPYAP